MRKKLLVIIVLLMIIIVAGVIVVSKILTTKKAVHRYEDIEWGISKEEARQLSIDSGEKVYENSREWNLYDDAFDAYTTDFYNDLGCYVTYCFNENDELKQVIVMIETELNGNLDEVYNDLYIIYDDAYDLSELNIADSDVTVWKSENSLISIMNKHMGIMILFEDLNSNMDYLKTEPK